MVQCNEYMKARCPDDIGDEIDGLAMYCINRRLGQQQDSVLR